MNIYDSVKKYIDEYDFDDLLAIGAPNDEYDMESERISQIINKESSVLEIAEAISNVFLHSMESIIKVDAENPSSFIEVAAKIKNELNSD